MARRQHLSLILILGLAAFFSLTWFMSSGRSRGAESVSPSAYQYEAAGSVKQQQQDSTPMGAVDFGGLEGILSGGSIAPKLGNETAKRELGRATWKFLHTMMARYPEQPTEDDQLALKTFMTLFSRLYPCGECAEHFRQLLAKYPPQVSSRNAAAGWLCFAHNIVNERLKKPTFDCTKIGDFYDCGCADDPGKAKTDESELKE
ncbi:hypothetical protein M406DRAFT_357592 [Cryphonectria parasitica EP155]|uniref:Sulfhydryl oxidase n=1 Tax=Cryphonectria parasitica (strain ATCC 38755 / EP155) TaxID=660469 RepID=A0A9P4XXR6_CRYP1|nr:uncharacterized protein M406DRAFT_357592 [Cryphonectria parasitica EP155]KAF3762806.1 hypothetical protein M406DRAFT_357592 [Cryphonectria parasitica EP155]